MQKKTKWFSYLMPYLLVFSVIAVIIFFWGGSSSSSSKSYSEADIVGKAFNDETGNEYTIVERAEQSVLWTENIQHLNIAEYREHIAISGGVIEKNAQNKDVVYSFHVKVALTDSNKEVISYIVTSRIDYNDFANPDDDEIYYNSSVLSYTDPYESNGFMDYLPTILIFVGTLVIGGFLISRLGKSINKSNTSAMDFNRSRARR